jgi:hypothetical protein
MGLLEPFFLLTDSMGDIVLGTKQSHPMAPILAFSVPIFAGGHFVGVAAADIALHEFDQLLTRCLLHMKNEAFIINGDGRIVAANSANWFVGNMASCPAAAKVHKLKPLSIEWSLVEPPVPR